MKKIIILLLLCFAVSGWSYDFIAGAGETGCTSSILNLTNGVDAMPSYFYYLSDTNQSSSAMIRIDGLIPDTNYELIFVADCKSSGSGGEHSINGVSYSNTSPVVSQPQVTCTARSGSLGSLVASVTTNSYDSNRYSAYQILGTAVSGEPPLFDPNPLALTANLNEDFTYTFAVSSGTPEITYTYSGLPTWLTANGSTVSGNPNNDTDVSFQVTATNDYGSDTLTVNLTVAGGQVPVITSPLTINATAMQAITYTITATGTPTIEYDFTNFPSFLSVSSGSPTITGTLPFGQTNFSFGILATNQYGADTQTVNVVIDGSGEGTGIHVIVDNFSDLNNIEIFNDMLENLEDIKYELLDVNMTLDFMYTSLGDINRNIMDTNFILDDINVILTQIQAGLSSTYTDDSSNDLDGLNLPSLPDQTDKYTDTEVEAKKGDITQIAMIKTRLNSLVGTPSGDWYFEFPLMWTGMVAENPKILLSETLATWIAWARKLFQIMVYACGWLYWFDIFKGAFIV